MKLIPTKEYLLLVDEKRDIVSGVTIVAVDGSGVAKVTELKAGHIKAVSTIGTDLGIGYYQQSDWLVLEAYFPLTDEAKQLDLPLLPNPFKEDDSIKLAEEKYTVTKMTSDSDRDTLLHFQKIFIEGYKAAQSKHQFSLEDIQKAIEFGKNLTKDIISNKISSGNAVVLAENNFIQSLFTQQLPKEFEPELDYSNKLKDSKGEIIYHIIINSEGKEVIQGIYKY